MPPRRLHSFATLAVALTLASTSGAQSLGDFLAPDVNRFAA